MEESGCSTSHGLGLEIARGLVFTESFYWDMNEATRAWSKRFFALAAGPRPRVLVDIFYQSPACPEIAVDRQLRAK